MELIRVTNDNLASEHICCAISSNDDCQVKAKKAWLSDRFRDGLVFLKGNVRGKCFIEYLPAEKAWAPVEADGYMYIDCLWVSGQFQGKGNAALLVNECLRDSMEKGRKGLVILSSKKKQPFLADPKYLAHAGFLPADVAAPSYVLMYLPFDPAAEKPRFAASVKTPQVEAHGFALYYTHQCPYTAKYVPLIEAVAQEMDVPFTSVLLSTTEEAQHAPAPFAAYSLFYDGAFITHEIQSEKKFAALAAERCGK